MNLFEIGIVLKAFDQSSNVISGITGSLGKLQEKVRSASDSMKAMGMSSLSSGLIAAGIMQKPVNAFMELEDAATQLKSTLMDSAGNVPKVFEAIDKEAVKLGNDLPGTTKDFYQMASSMKALGVSGEAIAGGALKSAAYLGVVLKPLGVTYEQAAEAVAKFKEAMGVKESDLIPFMDLIQKTAHTGVKMEEMKYAFSKLAGPMKGLGLQGLESAKQMTPLLGMIIRTGRSGEETGTAIGNIMEAALDAKRVGKVNELLRGTGMRLDFVNEKTGKFKGIENMVAQLDKLNKFADADKALLFKELLGSGGAADVGKLMSMKGYKEQIKAMQAQADLNKRVELSLGTLRNAWEAFTGTFTNFIAIFGEAAAPTLKKFADVLNDITGKLSDFAKDNQSLVRFISLAAIAAAGALVAFGAFGIALSVVFRGFGMAIGGFARFIAFTGTALTWIRLQSAALWNLIYTKIYLDRIQYRGGFYQAMQYWLMTSRLRMLEVVGAARAWIVTQAAAFRASFLTVSGLRAMALSFGSALKGGIWAAIAAVRAFSVALITSPVGWIALAIGAVALVIYKYWAPISGFFRGLWQGLKEGLKGLEPAWNLFTKAAALLAPVLAPLKWIYNAVVSLLQPVEDVGGAAEAMGLRWGKAIAGAAGWVLQLPVSIANAFEGIYSGIGSFFSNLGTTLYTSGQQLISQLWQGIVSMASMPVQAVTEIAGQIRDLLPFSPAKSGPLSTLDQVNIIGSIADTIKPEGLLESISGALAQAKAAFEDSPVNIIGNIAGSILPPLLPDMPAQRASLPGSGQAEGYGGQVFHINVSVTVNNAEGMSGSDIGRQTAMEIEKQMRRSYR